MPAAVLVEGVLETVAITLLEEVEDVATGFVPDILEKCKWLNSYFTCIIYVIVIIQVCFINK